MYFPMYIRWVLTHLSEKDPNSWLMGYVARIDGIMQKPWNFPWLDYILSHIIEKIIYKMGLVHIPLVGVHHTHLKILRSCY
jgi:hypothetical protein